MYFPPAATYTTVPGSWPAPQSMSSFCRNLRFPTATSTPSTSALTPPPCSSEARVTLDLASETPAAFARLRLIG